MSEPFVLPLNTATLAFGLDWFPLIGRKPQHLANKVARQHRASHMVFARDIGTAVGLVTLKEVRLGSKAVLHSAAQNIGRLFSQGTFALLLDIDQAGCWLVAVHDGAVIARTDRLYPSREDAVAALEELRQAYPHITVLGESQAAAGPELAEIASASCPQSRLLRVGRQRFALPLPIQAFILALLLVLLVPRLWQVWASRSPDSPVSTVVDARQAWQATLERAARHQFVHGVDGTRELLEALYALPTGLAGWGLSRAECVGHARQWQCHARYERRHKEASNDLLLKAAPHHWSVSFPSMDVARPAWTIEVPAQALTHVPLHSTGHIERYLFSSLQPLQSLYTRMQFGQPQPLAVTIPVDKDGRPFTRPGDLSPPLTRSVVLEGPLRSAGLFVSHTAFMAWKRIVLTVQDAKTPALLSSRLMSSFEGVLYETRDLPK
jgi:hypothetical protein